MNLQSMTNINVDFCEKKYILVNAKQLDKSSRFLLVTCYNHGELYTICESHHSVYIRYKKADGYSVLNQCIIDKGKVIVELTEQMLATSGICYADLIIVEGGSAEFDPDTGAMIAINGSSILSTMTFHIDVSEVPVESSDIESNYDFDVLNEALDELNANYQNVIKTARSWAVGGTDTRENEDTNNAKFWAEEAMRNATGQTSIVTGIKCANDTTYRNGQVTISAYNVGAISTNDIATVSEVTGYLGI